VNWGRTQGSSCAVLVVVDGNIHVGVWMIGCKIHLPASAHAKVVMSVRASEGASDWKPGGECMQYLPRANKKEDDFRPREPTFGRNFSIFGRKRSKNAPPSKLCCRFPALRISQSTARGSCRDIPPANQTKPTLVKPRGPRLAKHLRIPSTKRFPWHHSSSAGVELLKTIVGHEDHTFAF
jgi:hypothetical protein